MQIEMYNRISDWNDHCYIDINLILNTIFFS